MAQVFVLSGPDVGRSFEVRPGDTFGRSPDCIVTLRDPSVSRRHAHLERSAEGWVVVDDGSRNGVLVGGRRVPRLALVDQQEFQLGEVLLRFRAQVGEAAGPAAAPGQAPPAPAPIRPPPPGLAAPPPTAPLVEPPRVDPADEIVLEGPDEPLVPPAPRPALERTQVRPRGAARPAPASEDLGRSQRDQGRVLQYHRVPDAPGMLAGELGQQPAWIRWSLYLLALALAAALAWLVFRGTTFVRGQVAPAPPVEEEG